MSRKGLLLFLACGLAWGIPYFFIRVAVDYFSAETIILFRVLIGAAVLGMILELVAFRPIRAKGGHFLAPMVSTTGATGTTTTSVASSTTTTLPEAAKLVLRGDALGEGGGRDGSGGSQGRIPGGRLRVAFPGAPGHGAPDTAPGR